MESRSFARRRFATSKVVAVAAREQQQQEDGENDENRNDIPLQKHPRPPNPAAPVRFVVMDGQDGPPRGGLFLSWGCCCSSVVIFRARKKRQKRNMLHPAGGEILLVSHERESRGPIVGPGDISPRGAKLVCCSKEWRGRQGLPPPGKRDRGGVIMLPWSGGGILPLVLSRRLVEDVLAAVHSKNAVLERALPVRLVSTCISRQTEELKNTTCS